MPLAQDGKFILEELPPKTIEIVELEFSEGERKVRPLLFGWNVIQLFFFTTHKIYDDLAARVEKTIGDIVSRGLEDK